MKTAEDAQEEVEPRSWQDTGIAWREDYNHHNKFVAFSTCVPS